MSRWIALDCSEEAELLQTRHPFAFLQLCQIARRAKWKNCSITGLKAGEAEIGDWQNVPLPTERAYRTAKKVLERTKQATFVPTSNGTIARLTPSSIFSISSRTSDEQSDRPPTNKRRTTAGQSTTNNTDTQRDGDNLTRSGAVDKEEIYQSYPRKAAKARALKAIAKALQNHAFEYLLERTQKYAASIAGKDPQFIPYPAKWFDEERFKDEPGASQQGGTNGKPLMQL